MLPRLPKTAEVVIVGGGVVGLSVAYHLAHKGVTDVVVLEKSCLASGSTGKSAGGVRHQFASEIDILMSLEGIKFYERFEQETGFDIGFRQNGYLFLASTPDELDALKGNVSKQRALGVAVELVSPQEAQRLVPGLAADAVVGGTFCPEDGYTIPVRIVQGLAARFRERGGSVYEGVEAFDIWMESGRVTAVMTDAGTIATPVIVNAAGPYAYLVARMVGVALPVRPHRRHIFYTAPLSLFADNLPMVVDHHHEFYFRRGEEGEVLIGGGVDDGLPTFHPEVPWQHLGPIWERLTRLVPAFSSAKIEGGWAGLRSITPDRHAILGAVPGVEGFICATGFSGHGVMHAPAAGRAIAELILDGAPSSVDISPLGIGRFREKTEDDGP
jgi:sarcosine oxidase subunit beta